MLQFTVIAGPNGAGKSTLSQRFSPANALIFDPDKQKSLIEKQYPDIAEDALESAVTSKYHSLELHAIAGLKHLTVETNLRNEFLAEQATIFKNAGYCTNIIFLLLPDMKTSMDRVNLRVKQKGHFVDVESIRYNFQHSLENLYRVAPMFDQFMLLNAAPKYGILSAPELILTIKDKVITPHANLVAPWVAGIVERIVIAFNNNLRDEDLGNSETRGRGR